MGIVALRIVVLIVSFLIISSTAKADLKYEPLKEEDEISVLIVSGSFEYDDDLSLFLKAVSDHRASAIMFNSGGGNVYKAIELGKLIRAL